MEPMFLDLLPQMHHQQLEALHLPSVIRNYSDEFVVIIMTLPALSTMDQRLHLILAAQLPEDARNDQLPYLIAIHIFLS